VSLGQGGKKIPRTWIFTKRHKHFTTTKIAKNGMQFFFSRFFYYAFWAFFGNGSSKTPQTKCQKKYKKIGKMFHESF
jgi:hypothetical protein